MKKKNVMILGDSYSTFKGYIPTDYEPYYYPASVREATDVLHVEETWWYTLMQEEGFTLVRNDSWSGSTIGYRGYNDSDTSSTSSFIARMTKLESEGFFAENEIDTLFIFGGTNDSWCGAPLGVPASGEITQEELYTVLPAIEHLIRMAKRILPKARILFLINTDLKPEIGDEIRASAARNGIEALTLTSIHKKSDHPTIEGMADIKRQVKAYLAETEA
jgi:hypothetical protein